jgi:conjugal transfer pilus assembly protein TraF
MRTPPFSVAWIKTELPKLHARALDDPTRENVAAYLYVQRVALDKAETFTQVAQRTVSLDPLLDENVRRPIATFASQQVDAQASISARKTLATLAKDTGIFFFFRSDCPYCEMQAPVLKALAVRYGFRILPISLDGRPLPSGKFPNFQRDQGQAEALGVIATPAMFLVRAPNHFVGIGQGALAKNVLEKRILSSAAVAGWIDKTTLQASRAVRNDMKLMPSMSTQLPSLSDDPASMIEYLRKSARGFPSP